jgi:hypothetical protein
MNVYKRLANVQGVLKAPKNQFNSFGKYNYRSCEDILEAAKPLCIEQGLLLSLSDTPINVGNSNYIEATARVIDIESGEKHEVTASARESVTKKGMDDSQITGTASSYARKYALNGLFCIDDTKDSDTDEHVKQTESKPERKITTKQLIDLAASKGFDEEYLKKKASVSDVKYIKADVKIQYYDQLSTLQDKE